MAHGLVPAEECSEGSGLDARLGSNILLCSNRDASSSSDFLEKSPSMNSTLDPVCKGGKDSSLEQQGLREHRGGYTHPLTFAHCP